MGETMILGVNGFDPAIVEHAEIRAGTARHDRGEKRRKPASIQHVEQPLAAFGKTLDDAGLAAECPVGRTRREGPGVASHVVEVAAGGISAETEEADQRIVVFE